jgi:hypothetical protein
VLALLAGLSGGSLRRIAEFLPWIRRNTFLRAKML